MRKTALNELRRALRRTPRSVAKRSPSGSVFLCVGRARRHRKPRIDDAGNAARAADALISQCYTARTITWCIHNKPGGAMLAV
jgi:hypothetical protein